MYTVVFDARNAGLPGWEFIPIGIGIVLIAWLFRNREAPATAPRAPVLSRFLRNAPLILACFTLTVALFFFAVGSTRGARYRLNHGDYVVVEGVVSDFVPGDWIGHRHELWRVRSRDQDHWYSYSESAKTEGFGQTQQQGGPIHNGVHVRIADVDGLIARLEVATSDLPKTP